MQVPEFAPPIPAPQAATALRDTSPGMVRGAPSSSPAKLRALTGAARRGSRLLPSLPMGASAEVAEAHAPGDHALTSLPVRRASSPVQPEGHDDCEHGAIVVARGPSRGITPRQIADALLVALCMWAFIAAAVLA